ncbi:IS630 transposase [Shigella sonnei]|nr:IS630 transposase [Shigella sonnei]
MPIIAPISRDERRLMQKAIHKTHDKNYARRLTAMLMLHRGDRVSDVARTLCCARSSVGRWINWFTQSGVEGLKSLLHFLLKCFVKYFLQYAHEIYYKFH